MSKNLNSNLKKEENYTCDSSKRGIKGSSGALEHGLYGERPTDCTNYVIHLCWWLLRAVSVRCAGGYA
jgi:hypothetical protein